MIRSRTFKPIVEKSLTLQDVEKLNFSKPTEHGSNSQILESDPIINFIIWILAGMTSPGTEKAHSGVVDKQGWSRFLEQAPFSFEFLKVINVR